MNPAETLVRALDGDRVRGHTVVAQVMPVSHRSAHLETLALARSHGPVLVLGIGVATGRSALSVERQARRAVGVRPDVNGEVLALPRGPRVLPVGVDTDRLAAALGSELSDDAGDYVCNGWLYRVLRAAPGPQVGFLHLPA